MKKQDQIISTKQGISKPYAGKVVNKIKVSKYLANTSQIAGIYPFCQPSPLPQVGIPIGVDMLTNGVFSCSPTDWLSYSLIANPNMLLTGIPGSGKSATIKTLILRLMTLGVKTIISGDLKNEYTPLVEYLGYKSISLGRGLNAKLNPLDAGGLGKELLNTSNNVLKKELSDEIMRRRLTLLSTLLSIRLDRRVNVFEEAVLRYIIDYLTNTQAYIELTIIDIYNLLCSLEEHDSLIKHFDLITDEFQRKIEDIKYALEALIKGTLSGLFDTKSTVQLDYDAYIQNIDISRLEGRSDSSIAMILACISTWTQAAIDIKANVIRCIVRDELWRSLSISDLVSKIDSDLRLSRSQGTIQLLATHRLSDFEQLSNDRDNKIASNLIASCDTRIICAQDIKPLNRVKEEIGLTNTECDYIKSWTAANVGCALWKIGRYSSYLVKTVLTDVERKLFYTNERMILN